MTPLAREMVLFAMRWGPTGSSDKTRAMRFIDAHLDDVSVDDAARAAKLSVRTLTRRFDSEARMSSRDYLQAARMMKALELLARPGASVTQTAYEVGFKSLGAFTSAFRERCGETPTEYRARAAGTK